MSCEEEKIEFQHFCKAYNAVEYFELKDLNAAATPENSEAEGLLLQWYGWLAKAKEEKPALEPDKPACAVNHDAAWLKKTRYQLAHKIQHKILPMLGLHRWQVFVPDDPPDKPGVDGDNATDWASQQVTIRFTDEALIEQARQGHINIALHEAAHTVVAPMSLVAHEVDELIGQTNAAILGTHMDAVEEIVVGHLVNGLRHHP